MTVQTKRGTATATTTKVGGKTLIDKVLNLDAQADSAFVELAAALYRTKKADAQVSAGYTGDPAGFAAFCDDKLKIGYRKSQYLIGIYEKVLEHNITHDVIEAIGWSKAKEIVPYIDEKNKKQLLEAASTMTLRQLLEFLTTFKKTKRAAAATSGVSASTENSVKYNFLIAEADNDTVKTAIEEAKARMETGNAAEAFVTICEDWLALGGRELPNTFEDYQELIERHFGFRVVVADGEFKTPEKSATTPKAEKPEKAGVSESPKPETPPAPENNDNGDYAFLFDYKVGELQAFAAENNITVPPTVKGKQGIRDFIINQLVTKEATEAVNESGEPEEPSNSVDIDTATTDQLITVAGTYGITVPAKMKKPAALAEFRSFIKESLKAMGVTDDDSVNDLNDLGEGSDEELPNPFEESEDDELNKRIVAAEEERDELLDCGDDRKKMVALIKAKGYAEDYKAKFGQPNKDTTAQEIIDNVTTLISDKYGVDFTEDAGSEGDFGL